MNTIVRLASLVEVLYQKTAYENMEWSICTVDGTFCTQVRGSLIEIKSESASFESDIRISLYNTEGVQVDTFTDSSLASGKPLSNSFNSYYGMMTDLLEMARRSANGADRIVDDILEGLGAASIVERVSNSFLPKKSAAFDSDLDDDVPF